MANESTDVLMTFIQKSGPGVPAESRAILHPNDDDKKMGKDFHHGRYFEIDSFSLSGTLEPDDPDQGSTTGGVATRGGNQHRSGAPQRGGAQGGAMTSAGGGKFDKYIYQGITGKALNLKGEVAEISVSRQMDMASPIFFQSCMTLVQFEKAVIVKRKVTGEGHHQIFLRMEFRRPLITGVEWEDGDTVKETLKFICQGIHVTYIAQQDDGKLVGNGVPGEWVPRQRNNGGGGPA